MTTSRSSQPSRLLAPLVLALLAGCAGETLRPEARPIAPAVASPAAPAAAPVAASDPETTFTRPGSYAVVKGTKEAPPVIPMGDPATIARIIDEGRNRNQVMDHLTHLCTRIGARLTGSTNEEAAAKWARERFLLWGLANSDLWKWGEVPMRFDRGPSTGKVLVASARSRRGGESDEETAREPRPVRDLEFTTLAWTAGTDGPVSGPVVRLPRTEEEYDEVREQLKGAWVLVPRARTGSRAGIPTRGGAAALRYRQFAEARGKVMEGEEIDDLPIEQRIIFDGINGLVSSSGDERVRTSSAPGWRDLDPDPAKMPKEIEVVIRGSDYDFVNSRLYDGENVELEFDLQHTITPGPIPVHNVVAEIPGTVWPDEVVIVSAHLDSWNGPGSQGCTDNGTGSAVTLEAARILMAAKAKPKRTIRFILWTGEEQGLLGSAEYVRHLKETGELDRVSAVFVDDGGTNYEGGLKCIETQAPMLAAATAPINGVFYSDVDKKYMDVNIQPGTTPGGNPRGGSSDHASFLKAGVPGFFWDEVGRADYGYGWHTQHDTLDLAIPEYLVQSSTCAAVTAFNLACAPSLLPRPTPTPEADKKDDEKKEADGPAEPAAGSEPATAPAGATK